jgi:hypothetical protein
MSLSTASVAYTVNGVLAPTAQTLHLLNAALQTRTGSSSGIDVRLGDNTLLRTFSSTQLVAYSCCGRGKDQNWAAKGQGKYATRLVWDSVDYDSLRPSELAAVASGIKTALSAGQRELVHSVQLERGSLVANIIWKDGVTDIDALVFLTEVAGSPSISGLSSNRGPLGEPTVTTVPIEAIAAAPTPDASTVAPTPTKSQLSS